MPLDIKIQPKDIVAIVVILAFVALRINGLNAGLDVSVALIIGYYFGHRDTKIDPGK